MFKLILTLILLLGSVRADLPPTRAAGQGEQLKPAFNLYFPPSTVSDMGGINKFIDTGSENLLVNSGFEAQTVSSGWTISNATSSAGTAFKGLKSLSLSLTGVLSLSQEITATQFYPNVVSFSLWVKSSITDIQLCSTLATVEQECVDYDGSNQWKKLQVLVTAPSSGAMGLKLKTLSTTSGTILVDNGEFSSDPLKFKNQEIVTDWVNSGAITITATTTNPTKGTILNDKVWCRRVGENLEVRIEYSQTSAGTAGSGDYLFSIPTTCGQYSNLEINTDKVTVYSTIEGGASTWRTRDQVGSASLALATANSFGSVGVYDSTNVRIFTVYSSNGVVGSTWFNLLEANIDIVAEYSVPIKNWSSSQSQILTANDVVSSETINWQFKSTAITDCGGADAIGKYNTYSKAASSNTFSLCGTTPATLPNNADGFYMQALSFADAGTCGGSGLGRVAICIGKGLKGHKLAGYQSSNKSGNTITVGDHVTTGGTSSWGVVSEYNEKTGILYIDSATALTGSETSRRFRATFGLTDYTQAYIHFAASKNPVISALDAVPRIDYSWENRFDLIIAGATETSSCTSDPCVIYGDSQDIATAANRSTTGRYTVTLDSSKIASYPFVEVSVTGDTVSCSASMTAAHTVGIACDRPAPTNSDTRFKLTITRRSDYRSRGDAAAIIAQPTCYVKDVKANGTEGGTFTSGSWATRTLNTTSGDCSFLSLSSNQITLQAGKYEIEILAPAFLVNRHKAGLGLSTDGGATAPSVIMGKSAFARSIYEVENDSTVLGSISLTSSQVFQVLHKCESTQATNGLGVASSLGGDEIYTQVKITKVR